MWLSALCCRAGQIIFLGLSRPVRVQVLRAAVAGSGVRPVRAGRRDRGGVKGA